MRICKARYKDRNVDFVKQDIKTGMSTGDKVDLD